jgi:hypothetical protein
VSVWPQLADVITLVSGTPQFLERAALLLLGHAALFLGCSHGSSNQAPSGPARIQLSKFGCQDIPCQPLGTSLCPLVGNIFDFGLRPEPVDPGASTTHLDVDGILHPFDLGRPILHPSSFYSSGWGVRALSPGELDITFGFPALFRSGRLSMEIFPCVPL